jgi:anti-sigma B factor antagonist
VLNVEVDQIGSVTVCRPVGELDAFTVSLFRQALAELASRSRLLIDMSQVPSVDPAGLGALIGGIRRAGENGGVVAVVSTRSALPRLLRTTGFDRVVNVADSVADALAYLEGDDGLPS